QAANMGLVDAEAVASLEEALVAIADDRSVVRALVLGRLAVELYFDDQLSRCDALSAEALALARDLGDESVLTSTLACRHMAIWGPDNLDERLALADELIAVAEKTGQRELALSGWHFKTLDHLEAGDRDGALEALAVCERLTAELHQPVVEIQLALYGPMWAQIAGDYREAERRATDVFARYHPIHPDDAMRHISGQMAHIRREQGRMGELEEPIRRFLGE